ncbi:16S rRNA (guanine(966)-N(2))-methyltransferase RsmD [Elioraea tepida]|jgi:16S rRNA (guanine966-N2)-methyltransferase|uniref:16S rRNA (Guanine(966)-N(2))-methyltransferase RsmD n=1 Tax=Elioraea tepida TaxID=2843330 RepID=A0A975U635_9PROT|nr:16S rRNA (guanine(966)-N(2))-methyltransferase RsmD [Elioraea tepida]QXM25761.1 16S rRNA (guanine(966)-N(2))-methyltransferase RsmD [Elioraea tepida]
MRIIAGAWRGRRLVAPPGDATRPTADRARQAIFDVIAHAPFAGRAALEQARVLDAFAGTGAMGLEALSRGAAEAHFIERDRAALAALRANIAACRAEGRATVLAADALRPPHAARPATLLFLDPPYGRELVSPALAALADAGWIAPRALVVAELGCGEALPDLAGLTLLDMRRWGAAQVLFLRAG